MRNLASRFLLIVVALFVVTSLVTTAAQNPLKGIKDAVKKAQEDAAKQRQQGQPAKPAPATPAKPAATTAAGAAPAEAAAAPGAEAPWTPPADNANAQPVVIDPLKLPDVVGVHLGMPAPEALSVMHKQYPTDMYQKLTATWWPADVKPDYGYTILSSKPGNQEDAHLSFTAFPNPQLVWRITRYTYNMHINRSTLLAALREKYGKESVAFQQSSWKAVTDDRQMGEMYWLYDEHGGRIPLPPSTTFTQGVSIMECVGPGTGNMNPGPAMPVDDAELAKLFKNWCASLVGVHISIGSEEIVENTFTEMLDVPLAMRMAHASAVWQRDLAEKLRKEDLEKSKAVKPVF